MKEELSALRAQERRQKEKLEGKIKKRRRRYKIEWPTGPKFLGDTNYRGREELYEDPDDNSDNCVTAHGVRPDNGAATDAGADKGHADYCAGESEEDAPCAGGAGQTTGKT